MCWVGVDGLDFVRVRVWVWGGVGRWGGGGVGAHVLLQPQG